MRRLIIRKLHKRKTSLPDVGQPGNSVAGGRNSNVSDDRVYDHNQSNPAGSSTRTNQLAVDAPTMVRTQHNTTSISIDEQSMSNGQRGNHVFDEPAPACLGTGTQLQGFATSPPVDKPNLLHEHPHIQQTRNQCGSSGLFNGAHNFIMSYPIIAETINIGNEASVLKELAEYTIRGAEFDSAARDPSPQCHPGTRVEIIATVRGQIHQLNPEKRILWLNGPAGVGKSAIVQTVAELEEESGILGAALFFSRPNGRNQPSRVWTTISYQLATKDSSYRAYVREQLTRDPKLLEKSMRVQFKKLVMEPFGRGRVVMASQSLPILLDGLDECEGEEAQIEIIKLASGFVKEFPNAPLFWIIASRPEQHLKVAFESSQVQKEVYAIHVPADSTQGCMDVELFLRSQFDTVRERYPQSIPPSSQWPIESDFLILARAASGLFAFASAAIRFISDPSAGDPVSQLKIVLSIVKAPDAKGRNPLAVLHMLYSEILGFIPKDTYPTTKRILGLVLLYSRSPALVSRDCTFQALCNILGLEQHAAYGALHKLHSVLQIPNPDEAEATKVQVFHASFSDYLCNPSVSGSFWVDMKEALSDNWWSRFRILQQVNTQEDNPLSRLSNITLVWPSSDSANDQSLMIQLWKGARYEFFHQLMPCHEGDCLYGHLAELSDPARIVDVFKMMNFTRITTGYASLDSTGSALERLMVFVRQLADEDRPPFFQGGVLQDFSISESSYEWIDRDMISCRIKDWLNLTLYTDSHIDTIERPDGTKQPKPVSELLAVLASGQSHISIARLVGSKAMGRCVLLVDESKGRPQSVWQEGVTYYIIPYNAKEQ